MHRHPWISAVIGIGSNLAMLVMIILVSWTSFLKGDSSIKTRGEEAEVETERSQDEETENCTAASSDEDAAENVPVEIPALAPRSIFRFLVISSFKLLLLVTIGLLSFNAYQFEIYEPGKLFEITWEQDKEYITSEKRVEDIYELSSFIMNSCSALVAWMR